MAGGTPPTDEVAGEQILTALGYKQELSRSVSFLGTIALVVSDITPTASLLVIGPVVIATAGTGSIWAYLIGSFIAIMVALCMGELGSMYPVAGGLYSIVTRVLGRPIGFLALLDYTGQAIFLPASVAIGIGVYVQSLNPSIPSNIAAAVVMILVTAIAVLRINFNAVLTGFFLILELIVVTALALAGYLNIQQPITILTSRSSPMGPPSGSRSSSPPSPPPCSPSTATTAPSTSRKRPRGRQRRSAGPSSPRV
jgi:amino acid transporter